LSSFQNVASVYRTVGWGLRITCESALTAASGHIWIAHVPLNFSTTFPYFDWPTTEAGFAQLPLSEKFSLVELAERPLIVPARAFDDGVYRFRTNSSAELSTTSQAVESSNGWCGIVCFVAGAPASATPLSFEYIQHIEYIQDGATLYGFIDATPGMYDPNAMAQGAIIDSAAPVGLIETAVDTVNAVVDMASNIAGVSQYVGNVVGQASAAAGQLAAFRGFFNKTTGSPFRLQ
jgi:hypothetical protein